MDFAPFMKIAIKEAEQSLREGNNGFGAVILLDGSVVAAAHDGESTGQDPTSHAEINAIRRASRKTGGKLTGGVLISTHEPCPMCATAAVYAEIASVVYGTSIREALSMGRKRINDPCTEVFRRAGAGIKVYEGFMKDECAVLYREDVRQEIERLRNADAQMLDALNEDSIRRRTEWFQKDKIYRYFELYDPLMAGYQLLLFRLGITEEEAPIVRRTDAEIVFHSMNFCPTLEACRILGLDTRLICRRINENATETLLRQLDPRLRFARNYGNLRPFAPYCEEMIRIEK